MEDSESILVSINCIAYNHEKYIAQAIDSFIMQKTNFKYEILIHDDASTDQTAEIIREYQLRYPEIIKPYYQTENQYSKGLKVGTTFNLPRARGKYIAFCDGDDYWTDPFKLQRQIDFMEAHPEYSLCIHAVQQVKNDRRPVRLLRPYHEDRVIPVEELIVRGIFFGTSSLVYRKKFMENPPNYYLRSPVGDFPLVLHLASQGMVYYIDEVMSAYRIGVAGSWTSRIESSRARQIEFRERIISIVEEFNQATNYKYADSVAKRQKENKLLLLVAKGDIHALREKDNKEFKENLGIYVVALIILNKYFPSLYYKLRVYKNYILSKMRNGTG